ncbi:MAG: hypothetical protein M3Q08_10255 [Pseudomonadota bacterium]|nr:hypothetical protein [Pseudomonadota bacterium]
MREYRVTLKSKAGIIRVALSANTLVQAKILRLVSTGLRCSAWTRQGGERSLSSDLSHIRQINPDRLAKKPALRDINTTRGRIMKKMGLLLLTAPLAACASGSGPAPNFYNGNYYLAGDSNCKRVEIFTETRIRCYNSKNQLTGYRDAMTPEAMQMYQMQVAYQIQQMNALTQQVQQTGESFRQIGQGFQKIPTYTAPEVMAPTLPGGKTIKCIRAGIYVNCRE